MSRIENCRLINQHLYVGIERSKWTPREPCPGSGWAETISGKFSPAKPKPAVEVITLERQEFKDKTIYPKGFPVSVMCVEFCEKHSQCNLRGSGFDDLCKNHHKLSKLVHPVDLKWSAWNSFRTRLPKRQFVKSTISVTIPEIALAHERTEVNTFAAYSAQTFLDTFDDPADGTELEYTMDTGMASPDKSQAGTVPSFMYRTIYRDRRILIGFETRRVQKAYMSSDRVWFLQDGRPIYADIETSKVTEYLESVPIYKWIRLPTLRPIGCYLKPMKVIGSTTVVTRKERKVYQDRLELQRQNRHHERVLICQDKIESRKQIVPATC